MTKKTKYIIAAALSVVALYGVAFIVEEHRAQRMIEYAHEHNCKWYGAENYKEAVCR
jgi:hypothetical protein